MGSNVFKCQQQMYLNALQCYGVRVLFLIPAIRVAIYPKIKMSKLYSVVFVASPWFAHRGGWVLMGYYEFRWVLMFSTASNKEICNVFVAVETFPIYFFIALSCIQEYLDTSIAKLLLSIINKESNKLLLYSLFNVYSRAIL